MPIEALDPSVQEYISQARIETDHQVFKEDDSEAARKAADKKIAEKKEFLKNNNVQREVFTRQNDLQNKLRQIMGGQAGADAANALGNWENNGQLQAKLTEAQKELFREAMAKNPAETSKAAEALNRLSQQPGFGKAVNNSQQMGTLQSGMLKNPAAERAANDMLASRFMQSPKADAQAKGQFLRFGLERAKDSQLASLRQAGDMLGTLTKQNVGRLAQRAAMNMVARKPGDAAAMSNVDAFVQHQAVRSLPSFARTKSTELLAKADGKGEVKEGFEQLAADSKYRTQTAENKGRFFSTVGTGRASEYRPLTDKLLASLQSSNFPTRSGQVGKFLSKVAAQAQRGGAASVDTDGALKSAKRSALPAAPKLTSTVGLDEEELTQARSENRAKLMQFYNQVQRAYDDAEKKLNSAKYFEDVNRLQNLREAENVDVSVLSPQDRALVADRQALLAKRLGELRGRQHERMRELRTKRMPASKRRARAAQQRIEGRQPKYFSPNVGRARPSDAFLQQAVGASGPQPLPQNPMRGQMARHAAATGGAGISQQVAQAVAQLGSGPMTPEKAGQVAQTIANQVAQEVAVQVTAQLLGGSAQAQNKSPAAAPAVAPKGQQGKVDGWGIPRTFERDLGGADRAAVKPRSETTAAPESIADAPYTGKTLVKDPTSIRSATELFNTKWKQLKKAETALLKNLGWTQQTWDTKDAPAGKWPAAMATGFVNLNPTQRESVRKLGFSAHDWDRRVQAFAMGRNV